MARFIRFAVHERVDGRSPRVGLFTAAYHLSRDGELFRADRARLDALLRWFESELAVPPRGTIPSAAIFWYADAGPFSGRMWELAHVVGEYGFTTELVTARRVGRIVYQDRYQVAALPLRRGAR